MEFLIVCLICAIILLGADNYFASCVRFLCRAFVGGGVLWVCQSLGVGIGCNGVNMAILGLFGTPGFMGIVSLSMFL